MSKTDAMICLNEQEAENFVKKYLPNARVIVWRFSSAAAQTNMSMQSIDVSEIALENLTTKQMKVIIGHEIAHIKAFQYGSKHRKEVNYAQHGHEIFDLFTYGIYRKEHITDADVQGTYKALAKIGMHSG